jgi:hypothetical protein
MFASREQIKKMIPLRTEEVLGNRSVRVHGRATKLSYILKSERHAYLWSFLQRHPTRRTTVLHRRGFLHNSGNEQPQLYKQAFLEQYGLVYHVREDCTLTSFEHWQISWFTPFDLP